MSDKWEFGVAHAYDRFSNFDRYAKVGADAAAMPAAAHTSPLSNSIHPNFDNTSGLVFIDLDSAISTDYLESPFYLTPTIYKTPPTTSPIPGSEIFIGPSSEAIHDGAVERIHLHQLNSPGGNAVRVLQAKSFAQTHVKWASSAYKAGDQVVIRTVPHNWTTHADFSARLFGVRPAERYSERASLEHLESPGGGSGFPNIANRQRRNGVALYTNRSAEDSGRYIQRIFDENSFLPFIRRWRTSWDYRITRAFYGSGDSPSSVKARLILAIALADGTFLYPVKDGGGVSDIGGVFLGDLDGDGLTDIAQQMAQYSDAQISGSWINDQKFISYSSDDNSLSPANTWTFANSNNPSFYASNRGNRWVARFVLDSGINTSWDIDNLVIEHAHGTSHENRGFYTVDDWPELGSVAFSELSKARGTSRMANGSLKRASQRNTQVRWSVTAEFKNVSATIFRDLLVLEDWQDKGFPIVFRPKGTPLPQTLIGFIHVERWGADHWDSADRVSFGFSFEEI
jgi:hypothetical protein